MRSNSWARASILCGMKPGNGKSVRCTKPRREMPDNEGTDGVLEELGNKKMSANRMPNFSCGLISQRSMCVKSSFRIKTVDD